MNCSKCGNDMTLADSFEAFMCPECDALMDDEAQPFYTVAELAAFKGSHRDLVYCVIDMGERIAALEAGLRPFADTWNQLVEDWPEDENITEAGAIGPLIEVEDFQQAAALLRGDDEVVRDETDGIQNA